MTNEQAALCAEDQSITELVASKDKLIEQMRNVLKSVSYVLSNTCCLTDDEFMVVMEELQEPVKAALEAAGRGE
jgi:hypothetical protein